MTIRKILVAPHPDLKKVAEPVEQVDETIRTLMDDMLETMYAAKGIGLAAIQIGVTKRVLVLDVANPNDGETPNPIKIANPEVTWTSDENEQFEEGCLSVPGVYEDVVRPARCTVKGLDYDNNPVELQCDGLLAVCIQHEIDHLNGTLFVDHLSRLKRERSIKRLEKSKKTKRLQVDYQVEL